MFLYGFEYRSRLPVLFLPPTPPRFLAPLNADPIEGIGEEGNNCDKLDDPKYDVASLNTSLRSCPNPPKEDEEGKGKQKGIEERYSPSLPRNREPAPAVFLGSKPQFPDLSFVLAHGLIILQIGRIFKS